MTKGRKENHLTENKEPLKMFNEDTLRAEIVKTWGEYGAHAEVYDHLLKLSRRAPHPEGLREALEKIRHHVEPRDTNGNADTIVYRIAVAALSATPPAVVELSEKETAAIAWAKGKQTEPCNCQDGTCSYATTLYKLVRRLMSGEAGS